MQSPFVHWPAIRKQVQSAGEVALFLDYDGTLVPIAKHPSKAVLPEPTRRLLRELNAQPGIWTAIVSGRSLEDVRRMVKVDTICYVGNHGLELQGPEMSHVNPLAKKSRPLMEEIARKLQAGIRRVPGAWVEKKGLTLSVHSREVLPTDRLLVRNRFHAVLRPYQIKKQVRVTSGKEVFEVRPPVHWTKGTMVKWLLARRAGLSSKGTVLPVYIGDDTTDEDAFEAVGNKGITVLVGRSNLLSLAGYRVAAPADAVRFLKKLLEAKRGAHGAGRGDQRRTRRHVARTA